MCGGDGWRKERARRGDEWSGGWRRDGEQVRNSEEGAYLSRERV